MHSKYMPDMKSIARIIVSAVFLVFLGAEISAQEAPMPTDIKKALSETMGLFLSPFSLFLACSLIDDHANYDEREYKE